MSLNVSTPVTSQNAVYSEIDMSEYQTAVLKCQRLYSDLNSYLKTFKYLYMLNISTKTYHFKIVNRYTNNGVHIFIPPYNNNMIELYHIINNKKDNTSITINAENPVEDIVFYMNNHMFNAEIQHDKMISLYNDFQQFYNQIKNKFSISNNDYNFNIVERQTNNGYNISIDLKTRDYICVNIIQNDHYYDNKKYKYFTSSLDNAIYYIKLSISEDKHNKIIQSFRILNTRYIDSNEFDSDQSTINDESNDVSNDESIDASTDEFDPC